MSPHAVSYGAVELKQVAQRYWIIGLLISIALHSIILGIFRLPLFKGGIDLGSIRPHPPDIRVVISANPVIPGIVPLPSDPRAVATPHSVRAAPVPVPDGSVSREQTMATQKELAHAVDPDARPRDDGGEILPIPVSPPPEDRAFPFETVEKPPMVVMSVAPVYPPLAVKAGIEGKVWVKVLVGKDGQVREATVERSTADILNEASLAAARQFRFTPGVMNNGPVSVWVMIPFTFRLK